MWGQTIDAEHREPAQRMLALVRHIQSEDQDAFLGVWNTLPDDDPLYMLRVLSSALALLASMADSQEVEKWINELASS